MLTPAQKPEYDKFREERERRMKEISRARAGGESSSKQSRELSVHRLCLIALFPASLYVCVLLLETIHTSFGINQLLTASEERMAVRADFDANIALVRRAGRKSVTAGASNFDFVVSGMDPSFHCKNPLLVNSIHCSIADCFQGPAKTETSPVGANFAHRGLLDIAFVSRARQPVHMNCGFATETKPTTVRTVDSEVGHLAR